MKTFIQKKVPPKIKGCSKRNIEIYNSNNLAKLEWPDTPQAEFAKSYFSPLINLGTRHFVDNLDVELLLIKIDQLILPLVIVDNEYNNAYVCSPYSHYIDLAKQSLDSLKIKPFKMMAKASLTLFGKILKFTQINRLVYVNNWLLATDLHPVNLSQKQIARLTSYLKEYFPRHAIAFRSINTSINSHLKAALKRCTYHFIASRQIYLTNTSEPNLFQTRILKSDLKLWNEKEYQLQDSEHFSHTDLEKIHQLYTQFSVGHHSCHNPQLNVRYIKLMFENKSFKMKALIKEGVIKGVVGYLEQDDLLLCPFFAYDIDDPDKNKLYRLLSTYLLLEAKKACKIFHQSAGASFFKTIRRATPHQEHLAVLTHHLSVSQKLGWKLLKGVMNSAGVFFMKKY